MVPFHRTHPAPQTRFEAEPILLAVVDLAPLYPAQMKPHALDTLRTWYIATYRDQFFVHPPAWFNMYMWMEALYHVPLSLWAIAGLLKSKRSTPSTCCKSRGSSRHVKTNEVVNLVTARRSQSPPSPAPLCWPNRHEYHYMCGRLHELASGFESRENGTRTAVPALSNAG